MIPLDHLAAGKVAVYRPILRPRRGELTALHHLDPTDAHRVMPIIELCAPSRDAPHETADLIHLIREIPPRTDAIAVDLGEVPDSDDPLHSAPLELAEWLAEQRVALLPVVRPHDSDRRLIEHGLAARMHRGRAVVRLQPHHGPASPATAAATIERILRGTGLQPHQLDLVIDLEATGCRSGADHVEEPAHRVVRWARACDFGSVSVAAGAMPPNLDDLPTDQPVRVRRLDAALWARLTEPGIGYADYGVTSPIRRIGIHHRQLPTLRYTAEQDWWIYRWARRGARADDRCHDLCHTLTHSPQWPSIGARFSWGDAEIARRARSARGAGTPSSWIAWSTSHHIAQVLTTLPPPPPPSPAHPCRVDLGLVRHHSGHNPLTSARSVHFRGCLSYACSKGGGGGSGMLAAALGYAWFGIPVLPLHWPVGAGCSCGRGECDRAGKHPRVRHGLDDASTDPRCLRAWWSRWPEANIGLRTGVVMDVADVDTVDGRHALRHLVGGDLPVGPLVRTGGGWHLWFAPTGHGNRVRLLPGVDWRGAGGYVVAPPSRHPVGSAYTWLRRPDTLPDCPPMLRELIAGPPPAAVSRRIARPDRYAQVALDAESERVAGAPVGQRNDTLNRAAFSLGRLVGAGLLDERSVLRELTDSARHAGLGPVETARTIRSGLTAGRRHPWTSADAA